MARPGVVGVNQVFARNSEELTKEWALILHRSYLISLAIFVLTQTGCGRVWPGRFSDLSGNALSSTPTPIPSPTPPPNAVLAVSGPILANGSDVAVVSITLTDWQGSPMSGVTPTLSVSGNANSVSCGASDGSGVATCSVTSSFDETKLVNITSPPAQALAVPLEVLSTAAFRYTWNIPVAGDTATLPLVPSSSYDIKVYWGDGQMDIITDPADLNRIHYFTTAGVKTILIHGLFDELAFSAHPERLLDVKYWGTQNWGSMKDMFKNCTSLTTFSATDLPSTASVTDFSGAFEGANNFIGDISGWNTQSSTTMARMFKGAVKFNAPIGSWNVSNVSDFSEMFSSQGFPAMPSSPPLTQARPTDPMIFNQPLGSWNMAKANNLSRMFAGAVEFNQDISSWNTVDVTNMSMMFFYAEKFNQPLNQSGSSWNVSKVTDMAQMFQKAIAFNGTLNNWTPIALTTMERMFAYASVFNQPLAWSGGTPALLNLQETFWSASSFNSAVDLDVRRVRTFYRTFAYATSFNDPSVSTWTPGSTSGVTNITMSGMFTGATAFDQPLDSWGPYIVRVNTLSHMFNGATKFNQPIPNWVTSNVTRMESMFRNAKFFNQTLSPDVGGRWDVGKVTNFDTLFQDAEAFNNGQVDPNLPGPDLNWNTINVTTMVGTFWGSKSFNSPIDSWNTAKVRSFYAMFFGAEKFNQPINSWNTAEVTNFASMFYGASNFNQSVVNWLTPKATTMTRMFIGASKFNNGFSCGFEGGVFGSAGTRWKTSLVTDMSRMFEDAVCFNGHLVFDTLSVRNMYNMFQGASTYNRPMAPTPGYWDVSGVTDMRGIFNRAYAFNQDISAWQVQSVQDFSYAFFDANAFNQNIGGWVTSSATKMYQMFAGANVFNQVLNSWDVSAVTDIPASGSPSYPEFSAGAGAFLDGNKPNFSGSPAAGNLRVFITHATITGDLGGVGGADQVCANDLNKPSGGGTFRALLGSIGPLRAPPNSDWPLRANTTYYQKNGTTPAVSTDSVGQFNSPFSSVLDPEYPSVNYWVGLRQDWLHSGSDCNAWTSSQDTDFATVSVGNAWVIVFDQDCSTPRHLLCIEQ
jgi:surface protein